MDSLNVELLLQLVAVELRLPACRVDAGRPISLELAVVEQHSNDVIDGSLLTRDDSDASEATCRIGLQACTHERN